MAVSLKAQDPIPPPNPGLALNIVSGWSIDFVFDQMDEYKNGIVDAGQITDIRVGAIYDWKLQFKADALMFVGTEDASHLMELNNLGVVVDCIGTNPCDGFTIKNDALVPVALESSDVTLLEKGTLHTNKGYGIENRFIFRWEMGTGNGNMNGTPLLFQNLAPDTYFVQVTITLSAAP